ncbi:MAG: M20 family metallopeptidase [Pirellulales bacterium]
MSDYSPLALARELVAIPSVNPMGRAVEGPEFYEGRVTEYLQAFFTKLGLPWRRQPVAPGRDNIVARLEGRPTLADGGSLLVFEAHQDTVPVDGMTIPPWTPTVRDGRLYGRGACDIKGGMAAMLAVLARLAARPQENRPTLVMACSVNEEHGYTGATEFARSWGVAESLVPRTPDAVVVAEPTGLDVVVAHKGAVRWRCHTLGRAGHSSQPHLAENAFYHMAAVLQALEQHQAQIAASGEAHRLCGRPTLSVGTIAGGLSVNTVPDRCTIEIDRRLIPGESPAPARQQVIDFVTQTLARARPAARVEHDPPFLIGFGLQDHANRDLAERLAGVASEFLPGRKLVGVPYGTDAAVFAGAGAPTVVFGPGDIAQAHTADEWLALDQLEQASAALERFALSWRS